MTRANGNITTTGEAVPAGGGPVPWLLMMMAVTVLAPCILLPEWRDYEALQLSRQAERHRLEAMQAVVEKERRTLEAIQTDPAVIARMAQRELGFQPSGSTPVPVVADMPAVEVDESFTPEPIPPPAFLARLLSYLPDYDYDAVFCEPRSRLVLVVMCTALIGVALWLPGRRTADGD